MQRSSRPYPSAMPNSSALGKRARRQSSDDTARPARMARTADTPQRLHMGLEFPHHAAYDLQTKAVETIAGDIVHRLENVLAQHAGSSNTLQLMANLATDTAQKAAPEVPTIMLMGQTGAGKSKLTNCLLDDPSASKAVSKGEGVTCIPTFFVSKLTDQRSPYAAELRAFNSVTRRSFLHQQAIAYIRYHFEQDEEWSTDELLDYRLQAENAEKNFLALFPHKANASSPAALHDLLSQHRDDLLPDLITLLDAWCGDILDYHGFTEQDAQSVRRIESDNADQLNNDLEPYMYENKVIEQSQPALWLLVESAHKTVSNRPILQYVTLLDLPGTADANIVRSETAHKFIRTSKALWAVTHIGRAVSHKDLDETLAKYASAFKNNVAVLATHSDFDLEDALATQYDIEGRDIGDYWEQEGLIQRNERSILATTKILQRPGIPDALELQSRRKQQDLKQQVEEAKRLQQDALATARNSFVAEELKKTKKTHLAGGSELSVFCISNKHYQERIAGSEGTLMSLEMTGIPALRTHALRLAGDAAFYSTSVFVYRVICLLESVNLWTQNTPSERLLGLLESIKQCQTSLDFFPSEHQQSSEELLDADLLRDLRLEQEMHVQAALKVKDEICGWNASTIRAFINKQGQHSTRAQGDRNWNKDFTQEQTKTLDRSYDAMEQQQKELLQKPVNGIVACLHDVLANLESDEYDATPEQLAPLKALLNSYVNRLRNAHEQHVAELDGSLAKVKIDATNGLREGFFAKAMAPLYETCRQERGPGCTKRMLGHITACLNGNFGPAPVCPFAASVTSLKTALQETTNATARALQTDLKQILGELIGQLELALQDQPQTAAESATREAIKTFLKERKIQVDNIKTGMREVREKYGIKDDEFVVEPKPEISFLQRAWQGMGWLSRLAKGS